MSNGRSARCSRRIRAGTVQSSPPESSSSSFWNAATGVSQSAINSVETGMRFASPRAARARKSVARGTKGEVGHGSADGTLARRHGQTPRFRCCARWLVQNCSPSNASERHANGTLREVRRPPEFVLDPNPAARSCQLSPSFFRAAQHVKLAVGERVPANLRADAGISRTTPPSASSCSTQALVPLAQVERLLPSWLR